MGIELVPPPRNVCMHACTMYACMICMYDFYVGSACMYVFWRTMDLYACIHIDACKTQGYVRQTVPDGSLKCYNLEAALMITCHSLRNRTHILPFLNHANEIGKHPRYLHSWCRECLWVGECLCKVSYSFTHTGGRCNGQLQLGVYARLRIHPWSRGESQL